jgi:FMN phosphatase YigB (HAD superfamily)
MNSSRAVYFLDFDHTLFHTDEFFHVDLRNAFLRLGIEPADWEQSYAAVWPTGYTLEKHAEEVARRSDRRSPLKGMKRILENSFSDLRRYLFPDVLPFLQAAKKSGARLYLLSFGGPEWQRYKVSASHLGGYFDDMFFTAIEGGKARLVQEHSGTSQNVVVVDNNPSELDSIRDAAPETRSYCMNRVPQNMRFPTDELSSQKFLEARRYLEKIPRHQHIPCSSLDSVPLQPPT